MDFSVYDRLLDEHGIKDTWGCACKTVIERERPDLSFEFGDDEDNIDAPDIERWATKNMELDNMSDLYEYALAHVNKESKKDLGQYYTPEDVCTFMADFLLAGLDMQEVRYIVEPCCGCGNLLLPFFAQVEDPWSLIEEKLLLFDLDPIAIMVAKTRLICAFAPESAQVTLKDIKSEAGDFLLNGFSFSDRDIVIMNPPYGRCADADALYGEYETSKIHDYYPMFLERIMPAMKSVSITPQSFLGASNYRRLRECMSKDTHGIVWAYDNVPACIFNGRKHGVFNTNTTNSVRAAIIVMERGSGGYIVSPLIRWKAEERKDLFEYSREAIKEISTKQSGGEPWGKVPRALEALQKSLSKESRTLGDLLAESTSSWTLDVPTSPRYFTSAAKRGLSRGAKHVLAFDDYENMCLAYLMLNSSLVYAWWRFYDGGITLTKKLMLDVPVPSSVDMEAVVADAEEMFSVEEDHIVQKKNAGKMNENVKFPQSRIKENNAILFPEADEEVLSALLDTHKNSIS